MDKKVSNAVKEYQCAGCVCGSSPKDGCFKPSTSDSSCNAHVAGTMILGLGKILLGLPTGFNRLGPVEQQSICIFKNEEEFVNSWGKYDKFNMPVWKFKNADGNIIVRGLSPRTNSPFIHIFLYDCFDKINCLEITKKDQEGMD